MALTSLKLLREQGVLKGDLNPIQRIALQIAMISDKEDQTRTISEAVKSVQSFINPSAYRKIYKSEIEDEYDRIDDTASDSGMSVNVDNPEDLDRYLEFMFEQTKSHNSQIASYSNSLEVGV